MIQFYDLADAPEDVRGQTRETPIPMADRPLVMPLPRPPVCWIGGREYILERVEIRHLEAWRQEHGLRFVRVADLGQHGVVAVYAYDGKGEGE